jgi:hypothetical protein
VSEVFLTVSHRAGLWMVHIIRLCFDPHLEAAGGAVSYSISLGSCRGRNCPLGTSTAEAWGNRGGIYPTLQRGKERCYSTRISEKEVIELASLGLLKLIKDVAFQLEFNSLVHLVQKLTTYEQRHPEL